jgi:2-polyprenyl-6-methoxyphenol hydroxylase-like FAD-dependent oxidoreductase
MLVDAAYEAGVEVRFGHAVSGLLRDERGRPAGVTGTGVDGRSFRIQANFVVGADGFRSSIAKLVEAPVERLGRHTSAITYGYWSGTDVCDYEWVFVPDASGGAMPTNDGQTCVWVSTTPERIGHGGVKVIETILRGSAPELAARLAEGKPPANTRTWHGQVGYMRRASGYGWALVGDAGYFKDPLSAHGMTDALRDAELLARALETANVREGEAVALADYQAARDAVSVPMFEVIDRIASHRWTTDEIARLLKQEARLMRDEVELLRELDRTAQGGADDHDEWLEPHTARHAA